MQGDEVERQQITSEAEHLLTGEEDNREMADLGTTRERDKQPQQLDERYIDEQTSGQPSYSQTNASEEGVPPIEGGHTAYRVYPIRWFGLTQLILLNIVVSWDVSEMQCESNA